jgi:hypothetical protein
MLGYPKERTVRELLALYVYMFPISLFSSWSFLSLQESIIIDHPVDTLSTCECNQIVAPEGIYMRKKRVPNDDPHNCPRAKNRSKFSFNPWSSTKCLLKPSSSVQVSSGHCSNVTGHLYLTPNAYIAHLSVRCWIYRGINHMMKLVVLKSNTPTTNLPFYRLFSPLIYSNYANISHNMA